MKRISQKRLAEYIISKHGQYGEASVDLAYKALYMEIHGYPPLRNGGLSASFVAGVWSHLRRMSK